MTWVRLDDGFYEHPKVLAVSRLSARWVWVAGLAYSSRYRQDGLVPAGALAQLRGTARDAAQLVDAGLWLPDSGGGWRIHDYGDYQPMNGEISRKRSEAGRKGAQARWQLPSV